MVRLAAKSAPSAANVLMLIAPVVNKIKGDWRSDRNSPNALSRKKWGCVGSKSVKK